MHYIKNDSLVRLLNFTCTVLFQLCIITEAILGYDPRLHVVSKGIMLFLFFAFGTKLLLGGTIAFGEAIIIPMLYMIITILSCFWSEYSSAAISRLGTQIQLYLLFFLVYFLFMNNDIDIKDYINALYFAGVGMALLALYRYGVVGILQSLNEGHRIGRAITNENTFGMVFSKSSLVAFYYYIKTKRFLSKYIHIFAVIVFTFFAFSSGSKKAFLMILFGIVGVCLFEYGIHDVWKMIITCGIVFLGVFLLLQLPVFRTMNSRIISFFLGNQDNSTQVRSHMITLSMELFKEKPILGHGLRTFGVITGLETYSHNNMTEVLVSTGIVGFVLFYFPYLQIIIWGWKNESVKKKDSAVLLFIILSLIYLVFGYAMVECYSKGYWIFFAVMIAYIDNNTSDMGGVNKKCLA